MKDGSNPDSFLSRYCGHFHCTAEKFPDHLMWKCFAWPFPLSIAGRVIAFVIPAILKPDFIAIDQIARTHDESEFLNAVNDFRYLRHRDGTFSRRFLRFYLSIAKLKKTRRIIFGMPR